MACNYKVLLLKTILLGFTTLIVKSNAETNSYYAAVIGIRAEKLLAKPEYTFYLLADRYEYLVNYLVHNATMKPDIIVFPEKGLQGENEPFPIQIPPIEDNPNPCDLGEQVNMVLQRLSCLAKDKNVYLVINLVESHYNISANRTMKFNTNVVFNRKGILVARYRKSNLDEKGYDTPSKPDVSAFTTDFGVTFGLLTGIDVLFKEPVNSLIKMHKVNHFIHPTKWDNELPFLTGIQMQSSWAFVMNNVLLSAGYNDPLNGNGGSGIYQGQLGPLQYSQPEGGKEFAIVAEVQKHPRQPKTILKSSLPSNHRQKSHNIVPLEKVISQPSLLLESSIDLMEEKIRNRHSQSEKKSMKIVEVRSALKLKREQIDLYETKLIEPKIDEIFKTLSSPDSLPLNGSATINETLCKVTGAKKKSSKFCCKFEIKMRTYYVLNSSNYDNTISGDNFTNYYYRIGVYEGSKSFSGGSDSLSSGGIQVCGVIPCLNKSIESCALRTDNLNNKPPTIIPPASIQLLDHTYIQIGATFDFINIETLVQNNDSVSYPLMLHKSQTTDEFGSVPGVDRFSFTIQGINNTNDHIINLKINDVSDLGSIGIFTRIYRYPSSSSEVIYLCGMLLYLPLVIAYYTS